MNETLSTKSGTGFSGKPQRKAFFSDRDGVLNKGEWIFEPERMVVMEGAGDSLRAIKQAGFLIIVVTNQGGTLHEDLDGNPTADARLSREELKRVNEKMVEDLGPGAEPDAIKFCPHDMKFSCNCIKPKPGMLTQAAREFNIDLKRSYMVGDQLKDVQTGLAAGLPADHTILVLSGLRDHSQLVPRGTVVVKSIVEAAKYVLERENQPVP